MSVRVDSLQPTLPLEAWRRIFEYNPLHFWQLKSSIGAGQLTSRCNGIVPAYAWQAADTASREQLRAAIINAEGLLTRYLGYAPAPRAVTFELSYPRYLEVPIIEMSKADPTGRYRSVTLDEGYISALGVETTTSIDASAAVVYSDEDGDGYDETATVTVATAVTDPTAIIVAYATADIPYGAPQDARWEIAPLRVSIAGGNATIVGKAWQFVKPTLYEGLSSTMGIDGDSAAVYVTEVSVSERSVNGDGTTIDDSQGVLTWEAIPPCVGAGMWCSSCGATIATDPAAIATAIARVGIRNAREGIVLPSTATYNATTQQWSGSCGWVGACRPPDRVLVRAVAGYPLTNGAMDMEMQTVVARLAAAVLARPLSACDANNAGNRELAYWQFDLARSGGANQESYGAVSAADLANPLGTRRGHVQAWKFIQRRQRLEGIAV